MVKKTVVSNKTKPASPSARKADLKKEVKKTAPALMPRLAGNHNLILL